MSAPSPLPPTASVEGIAVYDTGTAHLLRDAVPITIEILSWLGREQLTGLEAVVLTERGRLDARKTIRRNGRKVSVRTSEGLYHGRTRNREPWIELVIDNLTDAHPAAALRFRVIREFAIASVLFHEVGHHTLATVGGLRDEEPAADAWARARLRAYFAATHPILRVVGRLILRSPLGRFVKHTR